MFLDFSLISSENMYGNYILCNHSNHDSIIQDILIFIHSMCGYFVKEIYSSVEVLKRIKGVCVCVRTLSCVQNRRNVIETHIYMPTILMTTLVHI